MKYTHADFLRYAAVLLLPHMITAVTRHIAAYAASPLIDHAMIISRDIIAAFSFACR